MTYALNTTGTMCVKFDYHMYGRTVDTLALKLKITGGPYTADLWSKVGNQNNIWYEFQNEYRIDNPAERVCHIFISYAV